MADDKRKRGKQDRAKVARLQKYEIYYLAHKYHVSPETVRDVVKLVGNSRKKVVAEIKKVGWAWK